MDQAQVFVSNPDPVRRRRTTGFGSAVPAQSGRTVPFVGAVVGRPGRQGDITRDRAPGNTNDQLINKQRGSYFRNAAYMPPANPWVNWTECGPVRSILKQRRQTVRPIVGGSNQCYEGMHTNILPEAKDLNGKSSMTAGRQNRLTVQQYRGQSYSATTVVRTRAV